MMFALCPCKTKMLTFIFTQHILYHSKTNKNFKLTTSSLKLCDENVPKINIQVFKVQFFFTF